jgi:hypothetical protein
MTNTGHWNELGTQPEGGMSLSAGLDGTVYKLGQVAGSVHLSTFDLTSGSFIDQGAVPITSAPLGNPDSLFALSHDKLYTNANGSWRAVYAQFASADIPYQLSVGSDGSVWILCQNGAIYSYDPATGTLKKLTGVPLNVQQLAAADASMY